MGAKQPHPSRKNYDTGHSGGAGKRQNIGTMGTGGSPRSKLPNTEGVGHKLQANGGDGYNKTAHSGKYHVKSSYSGNGSATGHKEDDKVPSYDTKLQGEGAGRIAYPGPTFVKEYDHGTENKAHHHPRAGDAHKFQGIGTAGPNAHGYGHPGHLRKGALRMSGHSNAHQLGCKKK